MSKLFKAYFKPGIYHNIAEDIYRADGSLSTSDFKLLDETPKKFMAQQAGELPRTETDAFRLGSLIHLYALQRQEWDKTVVVCPEEFQDKRLKGSKQWWREQIANKKEAVKMSELKAIRAMYDSYHALKSVTDATRQDYKTEVSVFCKGLIGGNDTKCRVDLMARPNKSEAIVIDIKTTMKGGASPRKFSKSSKTFKYHWQQANYTRMLAEHGITVIKWVWAVVEKEPPYEAAEYTFSKADMDYTTRELKEADKRLLACQELNSWPSYTPNGPEELNLFGGVAL